MSIYHLINVLLNFGITPNEQIEHFAFRCLLSVTSESFCLSLFFLPFSRTPLKRLNECIVVMKRIVETMLETLKLKEQGNPHQITTKYHRKHHSRKKKKPTTTTTKNGKRRNERMKKTEYKTCYIKWNIVCRTCMHLVWSYGWQVSTCLFTRFDFVWRQTI